MMIHVIRWRKHENMKIVDGCALFFYQVSKSYLFSLCSTGNAFQLSQLIRTLLDPENMALGANVSFVFCVVFCFSNVEWDVGNVKDQYSPLSILFTFPRD